MEDELGCFYKASYKRGFVILSEIRLFGFSNTFVFGFLKSAIIEYRVTGIHRNYTSTATNPPDHEIHVLVAILGHDLDVRVIPLKHPEHLVGERLSDRFDSAEVEGDLAELIERVD